MSRNCGRGHAEGKEPSFLAADMPLAGMYLLCLLILVAMYGPVLGTWDMWRRGPRLWKGAWLIFRGFLGRCLCVSPGHTAWGSQSSLPAPRCWHGQMHMPQVSLGLLSMQCQVGRADPDGIGQTLSRAELSLTLSSSKPSSRTVMTFCLQRHLWNPVHG